jgi:BASS family bile acid:Na+ symporter
MSDFLHTAFGVLARLAIPLLMLALGLNSARFEPGYLLRRPGLFLRSLLTVNVLLPLVALGIAAALPLPQALRVALVLLAISPGAPFAPSRSVKAGGDVVYTYNLFVALALLALATVPLTLLVLSRVFDASWGVQMRALSRTIFVAQIIPLALGFAIQRTAPVAAAKIGPHLAKAANFALALLALAILVTQFKSIVGVGLVSYVALAAMAAVAVMFGHLLGGPARGTREALAVMNAIRNPALAVLVAHVNFPRLDVLGPILGYVLVAFLVVTVYVRVSKRLPEGRTPPRILGGPGVRGPAGERGAPA